MKLANEQASSPKKILCAVKEKKTRAFGNEIENNAGDAY